MSEKMKEIIAEQLSVNAEEIKPETNFKEDLGVDSLDLFEMVMAMEEQFGIEIPSEDLEKIATVKDLEEYLKAKGIEAQKKIHAVIPGAIITGNWEDLQKGREDEDKNHRTARL